MTYVNSVFKSYLEQELFRYERTHLEEKHPEYRFLVKEYYEGILFFEIMNQNVWTKAMKNKEGLEAFFEANKDNYSKAKELSDVRGEVVADYQKELERQWLEDLRKRYEVKINTKVLQDLAKSK
ncbi:MAG: hypothetical protein AAF810_26545, partial [Cyanobacteria bacterium P01_D01_bin.36]